MKAVVRVNLNGHVILPGPDCDRFRASRIRRAARHFFGDTTTVRTGWFLCDVGESGEFEIGSRLDESAGRAFEELAS